MRSPRSRRLTARGESLASHRDGRGAPPARRDDREYREYLSEEQRSRRGCIARRMQPDFHHGLLGFATAGTACFRKSPGVATRAILDAEITASPSPRAAEFPRSVARRGAWPEPPTPHDRVVRPTSRAR